MRKYSFLIKISIILFTFFIFSRISFGEPDPTPVWPTEWLTPDCNTDPSGDEHPGYLDLISVDIIGDSYHPAVYYAEDDNFLYLRERVNGDPSGPGTFDQKSWVVLDEQTGDNYYDFIFSLNGLDEMVQIWKNDPQDEEIDWDPIFNDPAEILIWQGATSVYARKDSDGEGNWFVSWAIPKSYGEFTLGETPILYFATSADANNYNKDYLDCYRELFCGDGAVTEPEQCEYPDTNDNSYCPQTIEECLDSKLGTRDAFGNCNSICDCIYDPFIYQCVEGRCGAECEPGDIGDRCLPEDTVIYYCINTTSYETPEYDHCKDTCEWDNCETKIITEDDPRCVPLPPPSCSWENLGACFTFNKPTFNFQKPTFNFQKPTFNFPTFDFSSYFNR